MRSAPVGVRLSPFIRRGIAAVAAALQAGLLEVLSPCLAVAVCVGGCCFFPEGPLAEPSPADMVGKYAGYHVETKEGSRIALAAGKSYDPPGPQMLELKADGTCVAENLYVDVHTPQFLSREGTWKLRWNKEMGAGYVVLVFDGYGEESLGVRGHVKPYVLVDPILGPDLSDGFVYSKQRQ